jgi:hypothetical protein
MSDPRNKTDMFHPSSLLYIGELTAESYHKIKRNLDAENEVLDELGLPTAVDELGLPL